MMSQDDRMEWMPTPTHLHALELIPYSDPCCMRDAAAAAAAIDSELRCREDASVADEDVVVSTLIVELL